MTTASPPNLTSPYGQPAGWRARFANGLRALALYLRPNALLLVFLFLVSLTVLGHLKFLAPDSIPTAAAASNSNTNYIYDKNGNLLSDGTWTYAYDYKDRLIKAMDNGQTITYAYDAQGRRVKTVNGSKTTLYPTPYYTVENNAPLKQIFTPSGQLVATVQGTGASAAVQYIANDHLNSTAAVTNPSAQLSQLLDYYPYGALRLNDRQTSFDEYRKYIGQAYDQATGLNYFNARYYNPNTAKFLSQDPVFKALGDPNQIKQVTGQEQALLLSDPQILNSYSYGLNNPILRSDPKGLCPMCVVGAYFLIQAALSAWDGYAAYETVDDPSASPLMKAGAVGLFVAGLADPVGGGYGGGVRAVTKGLTPTRAAQLSPKVSTGITRLDTAIEARGWALQRGNRGKSETIFEVPNTNQKDAFAFFQEQSRGGKIVEQSNKLTRGQMPDGTFVQYRIEMTRSPQSTATIDINMPDKNLKLKFNP